MAEPMITDTERLDWLQSQTTGYGGWMARMSTTGRGFRLHETEFPGNKPTVREAIDAAMANDKEFHASGQLVEN